MALSSDLISKFVKATKDEPQTKKETIVYGMVTQTEPDVRVKLFDSNSDTLVVHGVSIPVASQTTVVAVGDKVECVIKNHKLSITGTSEYPAARRDDTVQQKDIDVVNGRIENLESSTARIDNLVAANVTIQGKLDAHDAEIDNLKAVDVEITGRLTAAEADIEYLKAIDIDVESLNAAYAFVEELKASDADIDYLVSTVAEIDNLIFGSATGDVIQTSFSNAVIAQLGDAQIKSAMIESVSAGKITAGDIITNNVRVKSEDGSLIISDETIKISEGDQVRVQIGKDAENDYSINIWDQNGNLMFSKGGITDAAIKKAIIRNDMVSDTANIHASKLDIDSLFEEINGSSNTIKSTQIYLDDEGQALDVAFKSLTTEVTNQGTTITSQGTQISTIQGQISSKIWQQDIDTAKNEMSTQYTTLEQEVDSFKTTVSKTYATKTSLDNLEIGGRNYIYDSANIVITSLGSAEGSKGEYRAISLGQSYMNIPAGTEVTISFDLIMTVNTANPRMQVYNTNNEGPKSFPSHYINFSAEVGTIITQRCSFTTELIDRSEPTSSVNFMEFYTNYGTSNWFEITNLKMEIGNKATDWSPAPEDIDAEITNLDARILSAESSITQLSNKITANVTETTNLGTRMTTVEQTADSLSVELENLEIGGRNLLKNSKLVAMYSNNPNIYPISCVETTENGVTFYRVKRTNIEAYPSTVLSIYSTLHKNSFMYGYMTGKQVTLSFKARVSHEIAGTFMDFTYGGDSVIDFGKSNETFTTDWKTYYVTINSFPDMANHTGIRWCPQQFLLTENILEDFYLDIRDFKIELGNKPTDWTPAPEDVESDILEASKTATNYLEFSSSGLIIGDLTANTLGKNVLIDSDSVDIRNGTTTLASFGADYLYLAKNSRNATIDLCNGLAKMYHQSRLSYDTLFVIETPNATEIRGTSDPLCVTSTVASKPAIKFANKDGVLGSIGMVASGTESYITRNHPSTTATYSILDTGNYYKLMDSGWFNGGVLGDNFTVYNDNSQVKYRKIGKQVQIMGTVKPRVDIEGSTTQYTIFTLPSGYRPPYALHQVCYGSNNYTWRLTVNTNGTVCFSRYGLDSGYVTAAVGHWINFQATFFID